ncbi:MAG: DeoR/GlpR family DNA-binding transcription regulator [Lachnospiraceae bacterium]|nr:DeoR/GlpR family DNA-binding transcription regulator [Lachnospiraceae bacterium]
MLSEQRYEMILKILEEKRSVTVTELTRLLDISESTARRDIVMLDKAGKLVKVFGGAVLADSTYQAAEPTVTQRVDVNREEKRKIAQYAVSLIEPQDFIYLDAGTTTGYMVDFIEETKATFVTNAVAHAQRLAARDVHVILIGGTLKSTTEAVVGAMAALALKEYHFTKGFFGANGVSRTAGYTTPDADEALVKRTAAQQCRKQYFLCDDSKFNVVSAVTFAALTTGTVLTNAAPGEYAEVADIVVCR